MGHGGEAELTRESGGHCGGMASAWGPIPTWRRLLEGASRITWVENPMNCDRVTDRCPSSAAGVLPRNCALRGPRKPPKEKASSSPKARARISLFLERGLGPLLSLLGREAAALVRSRGSRWACSR